MALKPTIVENEPTLGSWPVLVILGGAKGAILCRMDDGSPFRPALVALESMIRHHDPDSLDGYAAEGRACTSESSNERCPCSGSRPGASTKRRSRSVRFARPNIWRFSSFKRVI